MKLKGSLQDTVWENGQLLLVDIARRHSLLLGPTREMQRLIAERNARIVELITTGGDSTLQMQRGSIAEINDEYVQLITEAAKAGDDLDERLDGGPSGRGPDGERRRRRDRRDDSPWTALAIGLCIAVTVVAVAASAFFVRRAMRKQRNGPVTNYENNPQVVVGNPVPYPGEEEAEGEDRAVDEAAVSAGAPVVVSASTKGQQPQPEKQ